MADDGSGGRSGLMRRRHAQVLPLVRRLRWVPGFRRSLRRVPPVRLSGFGAFVFLGAGRVHGAGCPRRGVCLLPARAGVRAAVRRGRHRGSHLAADRGRPVGHGHGRVVEDRPRPPCGWPVGGMAGFRIRDLLVASPTWRRRPELSVRRGRGVPAAGAAAGSRVAQPCTQAPPCRDQHRNRRDGRRDGAGGASPPVISGSPAHQSSRPPSSPCGRSSRPSGRRDAR